MSPGLKTDVIISSCRRRVPVFDSVERVLAHCCEHLGWLLLIENDHPDSKLIGSLARISDLEPRVRIVRQPSALGPIALLNSALAGTGRDVVLVSEDCLVSANWLNELARVAHSEERTSCAAPLTNGRGTCSVPALNDDTVHERSPEILVRNACASLPRWTVAPALTTACIYLRRDVIDAVGLLDPGFKSTHHAVNDWISRSQALGFMAKRANHVYVHQMHPPSERFEAATSTDRETADRAGTEAEVLHNVRMFHKTLDCHLTTHAIQTQLTSKLRVAFDIRHLARTQMGTRTYAVCLATALAELPEIDLTLIVHHEGQAEGLKGRVVTPDHWADDVAVIHKPAQVGEPNELQLLFESSAHVVITYQDLIAYRIAETFASDADFERYRATSRLSVLGAQRIIAYSENASREITSEFGTPSEEIAVTPLGVDTAWFAHREAGDQTILNELRMPTRYFFSLATDYPHKNLSKLLDAYSMFRRRWRGSDPPCLVLAGYKTKARSGFYSELQSNSFRDGLIFLGTVTSEQLRVLYQNAEALVFPSLYEGFGLPPLEAMAAGTPVIAMPFSSVPEVGGDAVLYPDGLSAVHLARALESIASNESLRDTLRQRGIERVEQFRWKNTARATLEAYRSAVIKPSPRSLQMRRNLRDGILNWAVTPSHHEIAVIREPRPGEAVPESIGIRNAVRALGAAVNVRLRRELRVVRSRHRVTR